MSVTPIPPDEVLPCGCIIRCQVIDDVSTLFYIPCHQTCTNFRNALGLAKEKDVPVTTRTLS